MVDLMKRQRLLWELLIAGSPIRPMLRVSREDDCLWICDLPRRLNKAASEAASQRIKKAGFVISLQEETRLWRIDLLSTDALFTNETLQLLSFPAGEQLHGAYALYRMLKKHPSPIERQPFPLLHGILKLTLKPPEEGQSAFFKMTGQCAALLNRRQPLPSAACKALAQWICEEDEQ